MAILEFFRFVNGKGCRSFCEEPNSVDWGGETAALKACRRGAVGLGPSHFYHQQSSYLIHYMHLEDS